MLYYFPEEKRLKLQLKDDIRIKECCKFIDIRFNRKLGYTHDTLMPKIKDIVNTIDRLVEIDSFAYDENNNILFICPIFKFNIPDQNEYWTTPVYPEFFEDVSLDLLKNILK